MKDIQGIRTLSIKEQQSIVQWYRVTKLLFILCIIGIIGIHSMQWYYWYTISHIYIKPLCAHDEHILQMNHKKITDQLNYTRTYHSSTEQYVKKMDVWSDHLRLLCTIGYPIESATITKNILECVLHYPSVQSCIQSLNTFGKKHNVVTALCTSIKPHAINTKTMICALQITYSKIPKAEKSVTLP